MAPKRAYENRYRSELNEPDPNTETSETETGTADTPGASPESSPKIDWQKRYSDLQSHTAKQINDATKLVTDQNTRIDALTEQLNGLTTSKARLPKSDDEIAEWAKQFPDVYGAVLTIAHKAAEAEKEPLQRDVNKLKAEKRELEQETALAKVVAAHKDFYELKVDPAFHEWADKQSSWVKRALYDEDGWDADTCIDAIDLYKARTNKPPTPKVRKGDGSEPVKVKAGGQPNVDGSGKRIYTLKEIQYMPGHVFEKLEADIDLARKEGRIVQ